MTPLTPSHPLPLSTVMDKVRSLPALPEVALRLIRSLDNPNLALHQLEQTVNLDPALVARVLRVANSSFYGLPQQVATVRDAAMVLGFSALRNLAITASTVNHFSAMPLPPDFDYRAFWSHGMACALAAESMARANRESGGAAFTAGLLHDIGRLVLASHHPAHHAACRAYKAEHTCRLMEAEEAVLGLTHPTIGAAMATQWHFPLLVVDAIQHHHEPERGQTPMAHWIHLADGLVQGQIRVDPEGRFTLDPRISPNSWAQHGLTAEALNALLSELQSRLQATEELLGQQPETSK